MGFKLRRYRLIIEDADRLHKVFGVRISRLRMISTLVVCVFLFMAIGALLVFLTPLRRRMPGFITSNEREQLINTLNHLDTLNYVIADNQAYIDNMFKIMDTEREPTDSIDVPSTVVLLPPDSLKSASPAEREFVAYMEEKEKFNLNVLTPVAADAIIFSDPTNGGIVAGDSRTSQMLKVILPAGVGVNAIADGHVVERYYDPAEGTYSLMIQSRRGFLTRYSKLGTPLVDKGDVVMAGQCITLAPENHNPRNGAVGIEMWREGTPLIPGDYLLKNSAYIPEQNDFAAPRGK